MKCRVCLIGNSHIAALKLGWADLGPESDPYEPVFFGAKGATLRSLKLKGGDLIPVHSEVRNQMAMTSNGLDRIRLADYSAFVIVGMWAGFAKAGMFVYNRHRLPRHVSQPQQHLISEDFLREAIAGAIAQSPAMRSIAKIQAGRAHAPIFHIPDPLPCAAIVGTEKYGDVWGIEDARRMIFSLHQKALGDACEKAGVVLLRQPEDTTVDSMFTHDDFLKGSVRLTKNFSDQVDEEDLFHANSKFGARVLGELLKALPKS